MRNRTGVTVIEVLVALVVFSIGALGSAAAIAAAARAQAAALARREAVHALQAVAVSIEATPCATLANGQRTIGGVTVAWTTTVTDSLAAVLLRATHRGTTTPFSTEFVCH
jgi:Tfp pilus assembly protein PilV